MGIRSNIAQLIKAKMQVEQLTLEELAEELGLPRSSLQNYVKGSVNLRADTIELLAKKLGVEFGLLVSGEVKTEGWEKAWRLKRAAQELAQLPDGRKEEGIEIFLHMVELFSKEELL